MTRRTETIGVEYFQDLYTRDPDPWCFGSSEYEREKYAETLACLDRDHYDSALEVGCSIGVFTQLLVPRCRILVATEPSDAARAEASKRVGNRRNVRLLSSCLPHEIPPGPFQLIILSEVLYYLDRADAEIAAGLCCDALEPGGEVVLCHWLGETDYPLTGEEAADVFLHAAKARGWTAETKRQPQYRLDHIRARS